MPISELHGRGAKQGTLPGPAARVRIAACGIALTACPGRLLASETAAARLVGQVVHAAANGIPVALRLTEPGEDADSREQTGRVLGALGYAFRRARLNPASLEVTAAAAAGSQAVLDVRRAALGPGSVNLVMNDEDIRSSPASPHSPWRELWRLRSGPVVLACCPSVTSGCALLSSEAAADVIPQLGLQAPAQSAWLAGSIDLAGIANAAGDIDSAALERALVRRVDAAEALHDVTSWPTPGMQEDAWFNRRIAIRIDGTGELARRRGLDPEDHASLRELDALLSKVRRIILGRSQCIARSSDTLPAIDATNPCGRLCKHHVREAWEMRWLRALNKSALRHRNLVVMSPWSIFPRRYADYRYSNLLSLLAHADACEFSRRFSIEHWSVDEFVNFHRRVWAVRRRVETALAVAEQP